MTQNITQLAQCSLFNNIHPDEINAAFKTISFRISRYQKGALIKSQGDRYIDLLFILEGEVAAEIQDFSGKTIKIETLQPGTVIATGVLFAVDNALPVAITAQTDVKLLALPKNAVLSLCHLNKTLLENLLSDTGDKIIFLAEKIRLLKFDSLEKKIAGYLLNQSMKQKSKQVSLIYNLMQLADLFGVARPSLSRVLSQLYTQGLLKREGRIIRILDQDKLKQLLLKP